MAELDERLGQVGHHALGAAVEFRRDGFVERRNLCDSHEFLLVRKGFAHGARVRAKANAWSDGLARRLVGATRGLPNRIGLSLTAHYRDWPVQFELFFKRLILLQRDTGAVTVA